MGDTIRKVSYAIGLVLFLGLGITGIIYTPEDTVDGRSDTTKSEVVSCSVTSEVKVEGTDETEYTRNSEVNIVITNGTITGRIVTEKITYTDINNYSLRKDRLSSSGASYTWDDQNLSYEYKRSLESNALAGVDPTEEAIKAYFTNLGYTCK